MKMFWPMAECKNGQKLSTYGSFHELDDCRKQFDTWLNDYRFDVKEMWVDVEDTEDQHWRGRHEVTRAYVFAEMEPGYKDVQEIYDKGIILSSGVVLSKDDVYEISRLLDVKSGMESYDYAAQSLRDDGREFEDPADLQFYKEIQESKTSYVTGSDEIDIVKEALERR